MQHARNPALGRFNQDGSGVRFSVPGMNDQGQSGFCGYLYVVAECPQLRLPRAVVVVVVQARFAEPDHLRIAG